MNGAASPDQDVFVVIPAAGDGVRLGLGVRKAGVELAGRSLVVWAMRAVERVPGFLAGALAVHADDLARAQAEWIPRTRSGAKAWSAVIGGATRQASVRHGIAQAPAQTRLILVHDAARPLLHFDDLSRVVAAARTSGAAILASRITDTIKEVRDGRIVATLARDALWCAETPQVFELALYQRALRHGAEIAGTDEAMVLSAAGIPVEVVESQFKNFKITTQQDLDFATLFRAEDA
ncbi:MAG: 2-C-methyl-D-erythritol 4-phosphate cytidylyltransferase [Planctomycetota bacterium]